MPDQHFNGEEEKRTFLGCTCIIIASATIIVLCW
jgi:hypothetical protein